MQLSQLTWPQVEDYLSAHTGILIASGSIEQHGPIGLIGTDVICADTIANEVARTTSTIVAPPLSYTPAPFNTAFPGTVSISSELFEKMACEIFTGLQAQGFKKIYVVNGHGANLEPLTNAAALFPASRIRIKSWWSFAPVQSLRDSLYGEWEGMHATPAEVAITQHTTGIRHSGAEDPPRKLTADFVKAHAGDKHGPPDEHKAEFPDGRVGSHSALARPEHGKALFQAAVDAITGDFNAFVQI